MPLKSMTGFARTEGVFGPQSWVWEVRSVNGRNLDIRMRLPPGFDVLEARIREIAMKRLARGSITINLAMARSEGTTEIRINEAALKQVVAAAERVRQLTGGPPPSTEGLLALRGVLEYAEATESEEETAARNGLLVEGLERTIDLLITARAGEGARLADVVQAQLGAIEKLVALVEKSPSRSVEAIRRRIGEMTARVLEASNALDPARLHQEAALIATRADVEEELKRLAAHIAAARELLAAKEPVGRKFDFLAQEFNREANTLCSKANDPEVSRAGLDLKAVIDQMREQVQNIE